MRFPWSAAPKNEFQLEELLSEDEMKVRFETVSQFMLEYQKQYFDGLKFSLNMWILINSGAAIALLNTGNSKFINIAIILMMGVLLTGAASIFLSNSIHKKIETLFEYILINKITLHELYSNINLSFSSLKSTILFAFIFSYICLLCAITLLSISII